MSSRTLSRNRVPPSLSSLRTGRAGPAGGARLGRRSSARREGSSGPGRGSSAVHRPRRRGHRGRARPAGPGARAGNQAGAAGWPRALPAAAGGTSAGKEEARMKNKPRPRRLPPTRSPPPLETRGPFCREERKCDSHPRASEREKKRGGGNRGEEIGKAYFSSSPAVTPGPPCPQLAAPPRPSSPHRAPLPPSRLPAAPGGRKTHSHSRTQLILNRLNQ